jgi:hypothetical protein
MIFKIWYSTLNPWIYTGSFVWTWWNYLMSDFDKMDLIELAAKLLAVAHYVMWHHSDVNFHKQNID